MHANNNWPTYAELAYKQFESSDFAAFGIYNIILQANTDDYQPHAVF